MFVSLFSFLLTHTSLYFAMLYPFCGHMPCPLCSASLWTHGILPHPQAPPCLFLPLCLPVLLNCNFFSSQTGCSSNPPPSPLCSSLSPLLDISSLLNFMSLRGTRVVSRLSFHHSYHPPVNQICSFFFSSTMVYSLLTFFVAWMSVTELIHSVAKCFRLTLINIIKQFNL